MATSSFRKIPLLFKGRHTNWTYYTSRILGYTKETIEDSFNSGVTLFNIPAFVADGFAALHELERGIRFGYLLMDQCLANILFRGRVKYLHLRWNMQVQNWGRPRIVDWLYQQYLDAKDDPAIIHYITPRKPWNWFHVPFEDEFWAVARQTGWYHELQERRISGGFRRWLNHSEVVSHSQCPENPFFTIIMPVFNREDCVERAIRSLQLQEFSNFELIVIDDVSTDHTVDVVRRIAKTDARIKLIQMEVNRGPAVARNAGVDQARGTYIGVCDSDDFYLPGALKTFARHLAEGEVDVLAGNQFRWLQETQEAKTDCGPSRIDRDVQGANLMDFPEFWTLVHYHRCVIRWEFLQENQIEYPPIRRAEDPAYLAEVYTQAASFRLIQDPTYLFHIRPRTYDWAVEEIRDGYRGYELVQKTMIAAGYEELAFFFQCFFSPVGLSYHWIPEEDALVLAERLIALMKPIPLTIFEHPFLMHPWFNADGCYHDLLLVQNATPEQIVKWMRRGLFSANLHLQRGKMNQMNKVIRKQNAQLHRFRVWLRGPRFALRILREINRRIIRFRNIVRREFRLRRSARFRRWKEQANG